MATSTSVGNFGLGQAKYLTTFLRGKRNIVAGVIRSALLEAERLGPKQTNSADPALVFERQQLQAALNLLLVPAPDTYSPVAREVQQLMKRLDQEDAA
jgi:hypothetical protein